MADAFLRYQMNLANGAVASRRRIGCSLDDGLSRPLSIAIGGSHVRHPVAGAVRMSESCRPAGRVPGVVASLFCPGAIAAGSSPK